MSIKESIGWTDKTWNPIKGICPVGCWYCYARKMYKRFGWDETIRLDSDELVRPMVLSKPSKIFVCSTFEIFSPAVSHLKDLIFQAIEACPQHTFQILTKFPQNIDRPMPDNVWLGVTITGDNIRSDFDKAKYLEEAQAKIKFISCEPLFGQPVLGLVDWIIIGRLTQHGHKYDPERMWIENIIRFAQGENIPIFLKDNLKEIWGKKLIQEFPK